MSPLAALLLAAALTMPGPGTRDDPAVRVCELLVRQTLRKPASFSRTAEPALRGDTVELAYSYLGSRGKRAEATQACRFRLWSRDGRFHVEPLRRDYIAGRMRDASRRLGAANDREAVLIRSEMLDIAREAFVQDERLRRAESAANAVGIYPIPRGATALRP